MKARILIFSFMILLVQVNIRVLCQGDTINIRSSLLINRASDSAKAVQFLNRAISLKDSGNEEYAIVSADSALKISESTGFPLISALSYKLLASISDLKGDWNGTLKNYIRSAESLSKLPDRIQKGEILRIIGRKYFELNLWKKAGFYFEESLLQYDQDHPEDIATLNEMAGQCYFNLILDSLSAERYGAAAAYYRNLGDNEGLMRCLNRLGTLHSQLRSFENAISEYDRMIDWYSSVEDHAGLASALNQKGIIRFRMNDIEPAIEDFRRAARESELAGKNDINNIEAWSNLGICYQNTGNDKEMMNCFRKALEIAKDYKRADEAARIERIMATIYFRNGDNYHAELYCTDCIQSAITSGNYGIKQLCYRDYSEILEKGNDFIKALEYYEKYLNLRDSLNFENRLAEKIATDRVAEYDATEVRLRNEIAQEEISGLELKNLRAESARRENELNLLIKKQELANSEKERLAASLALEKERFELNRREQDILTLRRQQQFDSLSLRQKDIEAEALVTRNQLLETEKSQEQERAEKAKQIRNMAIGLGVLMVLVAVMILAGLLSTRKQNLRLAESKKEIEKINIDLALTNAEVLKQKDIIEQKNQSITDSIQYASRIQNAVLPPLTFLTEWGFENFILFKPKDIVSGDFYWSVKKDSRIIVAAADCTGHGVPGAFMSMLGHAFLDEIVNTKHTDDAAGILNILRDEIINTLKQKGTTGEARDGMDISLIIIDREKGKIDFAGANNPLYLIRNGEMFRYQADKMPIGIHFISFTPFTNQVIEIRKGDILYLFSDGYADQFGGEKGKKFMYKPFQDLLLRNHKKSMEEQKIILDSTFEDWRADKEQVDDVMVIGIKI